MLLDCHYDIINYFKNVMHYLYFVMLDLHNTVHFLVKDRYKIKN